MRRLVQQRIHPALRIRVQHEDLAEMRTRNLEQLPTVLLRTGERLLMPMYGALIVLLHCTEPDESLAGQALARVRDDELLKVGVERRAQNPSAGHPSGSSRSKCSDGPRVDAVGVGVGFKALTEDHANQVVRAALRDTVSASRG